MKFVKITFYRNKEWVNLVVMKDREFRHYCIEKEMHKCGANRYEKEVLYVK